jgi:hypothetical protein
VLSINTGMNISWDIRLSVILLCFSFPHVSFIFSGPCTSPI